MTFLSTTHAPRPTTRTDDWQVGDIVTARDGGRWKIRAIGRNAGRVVLSSTNRITAEIWWDTHLDNLPEKNA